VAEADVKLLAELDRYIEENMPAFVADLTRLARIPSVSSKGEAMEPAADLVAELLGAAGFAAQILPTAGFPVVYADSGPSPSGAQGERTLICYNHYDVQPAEPLELWESPPFEPVVRDGRIYARGISDDKGQLISRLAALRAVRAVMGGLPARVKFLVEGEEEIGSPHLEPFVAEHADLLWSDACVWEFGGVDSEGRPQLTLGLRGLLYVELRLRTMTRDSHSGSAHNMPNAAWRLLRALATIKDDNERVRIPGFYDEMRAPSAVERELLERMPSDEDFTRQHYGVRAFVGGHTGLDYKTAVYTPTANIAGIGAGWQGSGSKTVTPAYAMAKMDFRLLPDQDPNDIFAKLRAYLDAEGFNDVKLVMLGGERGATTPPDDPFVQLTARVAGEVYQKPVVLNPISGGSGPMWAFRHFLRTPIVTMGAGDPRSNAHSPNESMSLEQFQLATREMAYLLVAYGAARP
jgi:acetylornithine deacetylase/succinyl-diaminopimelate desuccinylase-like protein